MIRVIVVAHAIQERNSLIRALEAEGDIRVVAQAVDSRDAIKAVQSVEADVVTLDLQLPDGGGQAVIEQVMAFNPKPILVVSGAVNGTDRQGAVDALVAGAVDALPKPSEWDDVAAQRLRDRVRLIRGVTVVRHVRGRLVPRRSSEKKDVAPTPTPVVAIGASTGGPAALATVLGGLAGLKATVLIVQHIHPDFVEGLVRWMARASALPVELARDGERPRGGVAYIAPGGAHLTLGPTGRIVLDPEPATLHRPSADVLFSSLAKRGRVGAVGVLLTGIGDDGAKGLLELRKSGASTFAQDEATCAVFGMPAAAQRLGAVKGMLPLEKIAAAIMRSV